MKKKIQFTAIILAILLVAGVMPVSLYADTGSEAISIETVLEEAPVAEPEPESPAEPESAIPTEPESAAPADDEAKVYLSDLSELEEALSVDLTEVYTAGSSSYTFSSLEDFDADRYTADLLVNNEAENANMHLFLDADSPAEIITADFNSNAAFQAAVTSWKILTFDVVDAAEESLNTSGITEEQYYETALLDMLQNSFISDEASEILKESFSTNLYNNLGLAANMIEGVDGKNLEALRTELQIMEFGTDAPVDFLESFLGSFGDTMDAMDALIKACGNVYDFIEKYTAYQSLKQFCGSSMVTTLDRMQENCPAKNVAMKMAISKVRDLCEDEMMAQIYTLTLEATTDLNLLFSTVLNGVVQGSIVAAGGGWLLVGQALSKGYANIAFNTDKTLEQYFLMDAYADLLYLVRESVLQAEAAVKAENTKENARYLIDSLALYFTGLENGCDYASKFAKILYDANWIYNHMSQNDYEQFTGHCANIRTSYLSAHAFLLSEMWLSYFESDHNALYMEYMDLQGTPGGVRTYVEEISFLNPQVTWRYDSGKHYIRAKVLPDTASNQSIKYSSSNTSVVSVTADGRCTLTGLGKATVTAKALDGSGISAQMSITVSNTSTSFTDENSELKYTVTGENEVSVRGLKSTYTSYTVPETVVFEDVSYTVTSVAANGFTTAKRYLTSITLPDSIQEIGPEAFKECTALESINLPASLERINAYAFYRCYKLPNLVLPNQVREIGAYAMYSCSFTSITLPDSLMSIGEYAFAYNSLEELEIPKGVLTLGNNAFYQCTDLIRVFFRNCYATIGERCFCECRNLEQVELGRGVSTIKLFAFADCEKLTGIIIPSSVSSIGRDVFGGCKMLDRISVMTNNPYFASDSGVLFNKQMTVLYCYPDAKPQTSYEMPDTVTTIEPQAFAENQYLEEVILPEGLKTISTQAFSRAQRLKNFIMPDTVERIGIGICEVCPNLEYAKISSSLTEINEQSFYYCESLAKVDIPESIEKIGGSTFTYSAFSEIQFPSGLRTIGSAAFAYNKNLKEADIPDSVYHIGSSAFSGCTALATLHLPDGLETIYESSFNAIAASKIVIPEGITEIPRSAFANNKNLLSVTIPASVTAIRENAFYMDTNLATLTLIGNMPYIHYNSFYDIENLTVYYPAFNTSYDAVVGSSERYYAKALSWAIDPNSRVDISDCAVKLSTSSFAYNGSAQLPKVTVSYQGTAVGSENFSVTGKNNKNPGIATITIKGKNALKGSVSRTVKISPKPPKVTAALNTTKGISLKWNMVSNATGYVIYRNGKAVKTITSNTAVTYTDTGAKSNGTVYKYKIRAYCKAKDGTKIYSTYSAEYPALYLSRPSCKLSNSAKGKMTIRWGKNAKATGYQIKYTVGKTSKTVTVKNKATLSKVINVKKGKTYNVLVRSYRSYGGKKYYSPWSAAKSLKIKK